MSGVLEFSLRRAGYDVMACLNGSRAVDEIGKMQFDVIVTDFQMPGANGDELIRAARGSAANAATPIILCSARGLEIDTDALRQEFDLAAVISKPFSPREVMALVSSVDNQVTGRRRACC